MITLEIILTDGTIIPHTVASWPAFQIQLQSPTPFVKLVDKDRELLLAIKSIKMIKKI